MNRLVLLFCCFLLAATQVPAQGLLSEDHFPQGRFGFGFLQAPASGGAHYTFGGGRYSHGSRPNIDRDEMMGAVSGIGLDAYLPPVNSGATVATPWVNINALLYCVELQAGFGRLSADASRLPADVTAAGGSPGTPGVDVYGRNFAININLPIAPGTLGFNSGRPGSLLRGQLFGAFGIGGFGLWEGDRQYKGSLLYFSAAPGYRLYNNFLSAELRLVGMAGMTVGDGYENYFKKTSVSPMLTLRMNGLFNRLVQGQSLVGNSSLQYDNVQTSKSRTYTSEGVYETTTTTADVSIRRGTSVLNDIGRYVGIGPRVSFTRPMDEHFSGASMLAGLSLYARPGKILLGLNAETGTAGHASVTTNQGLAKRTPDHAETYGTGTLKTTNVFADFGVDISSLCKSLITQEVEDKNNVTTFASINIGYSLGYSFVQGQTFTNPQTAVPLYDSMFATTTEPSTARIDPRKSASGLVGGFFLGLDIGSVGFKLQYYTYRNAPLANNLYYTLSYRFRTSRRR